MKASVALGIHPGFRGWMLLCLVGLVLAGCTPTAPTTQATEAALQPPAGSHAPVIVRVEEREEVVNGFTRVYKDIYFSDSDGDAAAATYAVTSSSLSYPLNLPDAPVDAPAAAQQVEALFTEITGCWQKMELAYEVRIRDQAGNVSEPVVVTLSCKTPPPVDTGPLLVSGLSVVLPAGVLLLVLFVFLFRKHPAERLPALRSTIMLILLMMTVQFLQGVLHEGGHSLYTLFQGVPSTLYVHPFFFKGFSRPIIPDAYISYDMLGSATSLLGSLLITLPLWKRRSAALLPLVLLFPYSLMGDGFNVMGIMGDFQNVVQKTGLPAAPFFILGAVIMATGVILFFSLLPLAGLDPTDSKTLFVLPAAMWSISVVSLAAAHLFVPGSPIDQAYFAGWEIVSSANYFYFLYIGIGLAVLYVSLFRRFYPRLPAWLRSETVPLTWKDLRVPGILWAVCTIIGLIIVI